MLSTLKLVLKITLLRQIADNNRKSRQKIEFQYKSVILGLELSLWACGLARCFGQALYVSNCINCKLDQDTWSDLAPQNKKKILIE